MSADVCPSSRRVDGPKHSWVFDGDDPYVICAYCAERRVALTGRVVPDADTADEVPSWVYRWLRMNETWDVPAARPRGVPAADTATEHTRTSTPAGPDFCAECSEAAQEWVPWPCPAADTATQTTDAVTEQLLAEVDALRSVVVKRAWNLGLTTAELELETNVCAAWPLLDVPAADTATEDEHR